MLIYTSLVLVLSVALAAYTVRRINRLEAGMEAAALTNEEKFALIKAELEEANTATNEVAEDVTAAIAMIEELKAQVGGDGGATRQMLDTIIEQLSPLSTRLKGIANQFPAPEVPVDPDGDEGDGEETESKPKAAKAKGNGNGKGRK